MPRTAVLVHARTTGLVDPDSAVTTRYDKEARVLVTEREAVVSRAGRQLAIAVVIDRVCVPHRGYDLPRLIRFVEFFDQQLAHEVADAYDIRRGRKLTGPEWYPKPIQIRLAGGAIATCQVSPPFVIEGVREGAQFLLKEVDADSCE